ncbi:MAG: helix-turn-helix transcriptional regulator [Oscillibacter sp.]|nr:helix-turn-helix transcriptional regulator [Oscillibacter sp.]
MCEVKMRITDLRKAAGLTQTALAERLCLNQSSVAAWESGSALPKTGILPELADVLGVTIADLFEPEASA